MMVELTLFAFMGALAVRLALAGIFLHSALHALRDRTVYAAIVEQYRLLPYALVPVVALLVPVAMLAAAAGLLMPATARAGSLLGFGLMVMFTVAIAINLARGRDQIDCGCGGAEGQRLSIGLVVRNVVLATLLGAAALAPVSGPFDVVVVMGVLGAAAALIGFYFAANALLNNRAAFRAVAGVKS